MNILSWPQIEVTNFMEEGDDRLESPLQGFVFFPLLLIMLLICYINIYPLFVDMPVKTTLEIKTTERSIDLFTNTTNLNKPISKFYS